MITKWSISFILYQFITKYRFAIELWVLKLTQIILYLKKIISIFQTLIMILCIYNNNNNNILNTKTHLWTVMILLILYYTVMHGCNLYKLIYSLMILFLFLLFMLSVIILYWPLLLININLNIMEIFKNWNI